MPRWPRMSGEKAFSQLPFCHEICKLHLTGFRFTLHARVLIYNIFAKPVRSTILHCWVNALTPHRILIALRDPLPSYRFHIERRAWRKHLRCEWTRSHGFKQWGSICTGRTCRVAVFFFRNLDLVQTRRTGRRNRKQYSYDYYLPGCVDSRVLDFALNW